MWKSLKRRFSSQHRRSGNKSSLIQTPKQQQSGNDNTIHYTIRRGRSPIVTRRVKMASHTTEATAPEFFASDLTEWYRENIIVNDMDFRPPPVVQYEYYDRRNDYGHDEHDEHINNNNDNSSAGMMKMARTEDNGTKQNHTSSSAWNTTQHWHTLRDEWRSINNRPTEEKQQHCYGVREDRRLANIIAFYRTYDWSDRSEDDWSRSE